MAHGNLCPPPSLTLSTNKVFSVFFLHSSSRFSINFILCMHSLLSRHRFSEEHTSFNLGTVQRQLRTRRMHSNIRRNSMRSAQNTFRRTHSESFHRSCTTLFSLQPKHIASVFPSFAVAYCRHMHPNASPTAPGSTHSMK